MTTSTFATRADRLPEGLCWIAAHGDCPGGLAWKDSSGWIESIREFYEGRWELFAEDLTDHWGDPLVAVPRDLATASTDPAIRAWANSSINQGGDHDAH